MPSVSAFPLVHGRVAQVLVRRLERSFALAQRPAEHPDRSLHAVGRVRMAEAPELDQDPVGTRHDQEGELLAQLVLLDERGDLTAWVARDHVHDVLAFCKRDETLRFDFCMDVTAVDYQPLGGDPRFAVVYHLYSLATGKRVRIKVGVPADDPVVPTATDVWKATDCS